MVILNVEKTEGEIRTQRPSGVLGTKIRVPRALENSADSGKAHLGDIHHFSSGSKSRTCNAFMVFKPLKVHLNSLNFINVNNYSTKFSRYYFVILNPICTTQVQILPER